MREIKFRGKRKDNGEWHYGGYFIAADGTVWILGDDGLTYRPDAIEVNPETVGQYTGLKDKNGVEIYEGDLLRFEDYPPQEVVWEEGGFSMEDYWLGDWYEGTVVIGNIHDNPELMETV